VTSTAHDDSRVNIRPFRLQMQKPDGSGGRRERFARQFYNCLQLRPLWSWI